MIPVPNSKEVTNIYCMLTMWPAVFQVLLHVQANLICASQPLMWEGVGCVCYDYPDFTDEKTEDTIKISVNYSAIYFIKYVRMSVIYDL